MAGDQPGASTFWSMECAAIGSTEESAHLSTVGRVGMQHCQQMGIQVEHLCAGAALAIGTRRAAGGSEGALPGW